MHFIDRLRAKCISLFRPVNCDPGHTRGLVVEDILKFAGWLPCSRHKPKLCQTPCAATVFNESHFFEKRVKVFSEGSLKLLAQLVRSPNIPLLMQPTGTTTKAALGAGLTLGALGVVFGDIGTSPLYALRECLNYLPPVERAAGVLGALSLVFWAMLLVVVAKYLVVITRADNRGEGGIFALLALSHGDRGKNAQGIGALTLLILLGAALLYGDGMITPAVSVLSAVEGLNTFDPSFAHKVPFISAVILAGLFAIQAKGTKTIGRIFGPAMLVWFLVIGGLGLWHIRAAPEVFQALNPLLGLRLLVDHPSQAAGLLGAVVL